MAERSALDRMDAFLAETAREGVRVKGTAIAAVAGYVRQNWGDAGLAQLATQVPSANAARLLSGPVLQASWYSFADFVSLLQSGDALFPASTSFARRQGAYGAETDLSGVYRVFVRLSSPNYLVSRAAHVWRQYYTSGELHVLESTGTRVQFELRGFGTPHWAHCDAVLGWCERAARFTGAHVTHSEHTSCRGRGERRCVFDVAWT